MTCAPRPIAVRNAERKWLNRDRCKFNYRQIDASGDLAYVWRRQKNIETRTSPSYP